MSDNTIIQSARLVPYTKRPKQGSGYVNVYVHEPEPDSPAHAFGSLYVVSEALIGGRASEDVIDIIIGTFGDHYYNHGSDQPFPLARFEQAIKATNKELAAFVDRGNASWLGKLSSVIAVIIDCEVHVAHTGSAEAFLARGKSSTRITTSEVTRPATPTKTFGSIASGELEIGDRLLFSTPALIHHVPLPKLSSLLRNSSPNTAIAELTGLLKDATQERVGAVICEITTPELAALQLRSEQPSEIELGAPENAIQAAKLAAAPIAQGTVSIGQRIHSLGKAAYHQGRPVARRTSLAAAAGVRSMLGTSWGRRGLAVAIVLILAFTGTSMWFGMQDKAHQKLFITYQSVYADFLSVKNQTGAAGVAALSDIQKRLDALGVHKQTINRELANSNLLDHEPTSYEAFRTSVVQQLDTLSGLTTRQPKLIKDLTSPNQTAERMELVGNKIVIFGSGKNAAIRVMNLGTSAVTVSNTKFASIGAVTATSVSASGDGVYILTSTPSVWLYTPANDVLTQQTVAYGSWPSGSAIAAYASNLYILADNTIYKYVRAATGFSPRTTYLSLLGDNAGASTMAIDGSVYTLNPNQLTEFVAGVQQATAKLPVAIAGTDHLRSAANGKFVTAVNSNAKRIIVFSSSSNSLAFQSQLGIQDVTKLADGIYDPASGNVIILADDKLYTVGLKS